MTKLRAHVRLHFRAHNVPNGGPKERGPRVHQAEEQVQRPNFQHQLQGQPGQVVDAQIRYIADQKGQGQLAQGGQGRAEQVEDQNRLIFAKIGQKAPYQAFLPLV